jgi:hypothetical protein
MGEMPDAIESRKEAVNLASFTALSRDENMAAFGIINSKGLLGG